MVIPKHLGRMFIARVHVNEDTGCWEWTGGKSHNGYGSLKVRGRSVRAHRFAYEALVGKIPEGLHLDHLCRVRLCVNPEHLEPVSLSENNKRSGAAKTHCKHGHERTPENTYVCSRGWKQCRVCDTERHARRKT